MAVDGDCADNNLHPLKLCPWCKKELEVEKFAKGSHQCRECRKEYRRDYYLKNRAFEKDRSAEWAKQNPDRRNEWKRVDRTLWTPEQRERQRQINRESYYRDNYGKDWKRFMEWREADKEARKALEKADPEWTRNAKRRESGFYKITYQRRKVSGAIARYNQSRRAKRAARKAVDRERQAGALEYDAGLPSGED